MIKLYLAGCIGYYYNNNIYFKATDWRLDLINHLEDINNRLKSRQFTYFDPTINFPDNYETANDKTVVDQNNHYLNNCDILVVNLEDLDRSYGTIYEMIYYRTQNKPVIAFGDNDSGILSSPHIAECITVKLDDVGDVAEYIDSYYVQ